MERTKLATARYEKGWSQEEVAERVGVTRNTFSKWERGVVTPYPFHIHRLCKLFVKTTEELGLLPRVGTRHDMQQVEMEPMSQTSLLPQNGLLHNVEIEAFTSSLFLLTSIDASPEKLMEVMSYPTRRQILHNLLMIGSTALVLSPYALLHPGNSEQLNLSVLEELESITASYWRLCANTSLDLLGNVSEHFRIVVNLLRQILPHRTTQRLCSLAGEIAQILGKTLFDLQEYTLAWSYYMFSLKASQAASNHDLWAVGNGRMILLLIYSKNLQNALPLLQEIHQLTIQNKRITCWLAAVEAEVHAHLGDAEACDTALKAAKNIVQNEPLGEDCYATGFNASRLAGYEGACFVRLHQPDRALPALQQALALLDPQAIRRKSTLLTDIGIAYAQQGNVLQACQLARQALSITKQTRSRSVLERVRMIRSELDDWKQTNEVQDLEKQLHMTSKFITA